MDLALDNLQKMICDKIHTISTNQPTNQLQHLVIKILFAFFILESKLL